MIGLFATVYFQFRLALYIVIQVCRRNLIANGYSIFICYKLRYNRLQMPRFRWFSNSNRGCYSSECVVWAFERVNRDRIGERIMKIIVIKTWFSPLNPDAASWLILLIHNVLYIRPYMPNRIIIACYNMLKAKSCLWRSTLFSFRCTRVRLLQREIIPQQVFNDNEQR